jgi:hypothetical protein
MHLATLGSRAPAWYTFVSGGFLLLQGMSTLLFRLVPALDRAFPALLETTRMIPVHSTLHIVTGLLALGTLRWGGTRGPWWFALLFGLFYTALGLIGILAGQTFGLGLQPFDHPFHLLVGVPGLLAAALGYRQNLSTGHMPV